MTENIRQNTKLLGWRGVLGRKDFITNVAVCSFISLLLSVLLFYKLFYMVFVLPSISLLLWTICLFYVFFANAVRRIRDVVGNNNSIGYYFSLCIAVICLVSPFLWIPLFIVLMVKKGKIVKNSAEKDIDNSSEKNITLAGKVILTIFLLFLLKIFIYAVIFAYELSNITTL